MGREHLSQRDVARVRKRIAREQGVKFPKMRVEFTAKKRDDCDYASFTARGDDRKIKDVRVRVYKGEPAPLQVVALEHELREIAGVLKGKSVGAAHREAMHAEKKSLKKLPYRNASGKPYKETLPLLRKYDGSMRRGARKASFWQRLRQRMGFP